MEQSQIWVKNTEKKEQIKKKDAMAIGHSILYFYSG